MTQDDWSRNQRWLRQRRWCGFLYSGVTVDRAGWPGVVGPVTTSQCCGSDCGHGLRFSVSMSSDGVSTSGAVTSWLPLS